MLRVGDKTRLNEEGKMNDCYDDFKDKELIVTAVYTSKEENPYYDETFDGHPLYEFEFEDGTDCPDALYGYEVENGGDLE